MIIEVLYGVMPFAFLWLMQRNAVAHRAQIRELFELAMLARAEEPKDVASAIVELKAEPEKLPEASSGPGQPHGVMLADGDELSFLTAPPASLLRDMPEERIRYVDHS